MKIYIIRHGLTNYNKIGRINSRGVDEPLAPEGVAQAEETSQNMPEGIVKIYASPLLRTRQTADILNKDLGLEIEYAPELMEVDFGLFTDRTWVEIEEEYKGFRRSFTDQTYDFTSHNGESITDVVGRARKMIEKIKKDHVNERVLLVTHGGVVRAIHNIYNNEILGETKNATIYEIEV
ncbi:MAG TPA: histidine phosphatase family protein [Candidatus Paceibacterota bacterium]